MSADAELLRLLVEEGNREAAKRHLSKIKLSVPRRRKVELLRIMDQTPPRKQAIFTPLLGEDCPDLSCRVRAERDGTPASCLGDTARAAVDRAVKDAWELAGGSGPRPKLGVQVDLAEKVEPPQKINGPSLYLPALLATIAELGQVTPTRNVMATGSFEDPLKGLAEKLEIFDAARDVLGLDRLLAASSSAISHQVAPDDDRVTVCETPAEAVSRAFGWVPWLPGVEDRRIHVYCGESRHEGPWPEGEYEKIRLLSDELEPAHLDGAVMQVMEVLSGAQRAEVSLAVPQPVAARLGYELKNYRPTQVVVRFDDDSGGGPERWWSNRIKLHGGSRDSGEDIKLLVASGSITVEGWDTLALREPLKPGDMVPAMERLLARVADAGTVHVAVKGPLPLAWAVGHALRNVKHVRFFHWDRKRGEYIPWFEG